MDIEFHNGKILHGDVLDRIKEIDDNSIDEICTDPPYGYGFMNKDWDKAVVSVDVWKECLRVLKPGAFAFVMSAPRQDVLSHMIVNLTNGGFRTNFTSIYWAYASGFPKAANIAKLVDKRNGRDSQPYKDLGVYLKSSRLKLKILQSEISKNFSSKTGGLTGCVSNWELGMNVPTKQQWKILKEKLFLNNSFNELIEREEAQREIIGKNKKADLKDHVFFGDLEKAKEKGIAIGYGEFNITKSATNEAKKLDGSYAGFQPKPAVEVILVCMKPLSEKNYVEQALSNGKGVTWFDDCRIPYKNDSDREVVKNKTNKSITTSSPKFGKESWDIRLGEFGNPQGRFPANLLVSDNVLDVGKITKSKAGIRKNNNTDSILEKGFEGKPKEIYSSANDEGDFSRYFSLDSWEAQFIITPKPSKSEKNKGLEQYLYKTDQYEGKYPKSQVIGKKVNDGRKKDADNPFQRGKTIRQNTHPTVKPVSLFKYLVTLGSRTGDCVLDPFMGSGTTAIACEELSRDWRGIEISEEYIEICKKRLTPWNSLRLDEFV